MIRNIPMTMEDGSKRLDVFLEFTDREILKGGGKITTEFGKTQAESDFEKYRIVQDRLFVSDLNREIEKFLGGKK